MLHVVRSLVTVGCETFMTRDLPEGETIALDLLIPVAANPVTGLDKKATISKQKTTMELLGNIHLNEQL